jgi:Uma2 family endonuclease
MALTAQQLADLMPDATQVESNEPEMESSLHYAQLALLVSCLEWLWRDRSDFFIGANLTIYFSRQQLKTHVWEEGGKYPDLIIELLSDSTAATDRTIKKDLYQARFRTPEYFWFSPETLEFAGFRLMGRTYTAIAPNPAGWLWSEELELYLGVQNGQLRYFDAEGQLVPTPAEDAAQVQQQAKLAQQRAEQLAEQLRSLGVEPDA